MVAGSRSDDFALDILLQEYAEIGDEIRYRDRVIHNSYYLLVIIFGVFAQGTLGLITNASSSTPTTAGYASAGILSYGAGGAFLFLSFIIYTYNERRLEAMLRRFEVAKCVNDRYSDDLHIQKILYPNLPKHREKMMTFDDRGLMSLGPRLIAHVVAIGGSGWIFIGTASALYLVGLNSIPIIVAASLISGVILIISFRILDGVEINPKYQPNIDPDISEGYIERRTQEQ